MNPSSYAISFRVKDLFEDILACPVSRQPLRVMNPSEVEEFNAYISRGKIITLDSKTRKEALEGALVSVDRKYIYEIRDGIPILLRSAVLIKNSEMAQIPRNIVMDKETELVQEFYDNFAWRKNPEGQFQGEIAFVDQRDIAQDYLIACDLRVKRYLPDRGKYLIDIGSGAINGVQIAYSENFDYRVCIDLSITALREARKRIGDRGIYIVGDVADLPLQDSKADALLCLQVIYHVPANKQARALEEVSRVLKPKSPGIVVYSWGLHSPIQRGTRFLSRIEKKMRKFIKFGNYDSRLLAVPSFYFHAHSYEWFVRTTWSFQYKVVVWASVDAVFTKMFAHEHFFGRELLRLVFWLEDHFPQSAGRYGVYALILIEKIQLSE